MFSLPFFGDFRVCNRQRENVQLEEPHILSRILWEVVRDRVAQRMCGSSSHTFSLTFCGTSYPTRQRECAVLRAAHSLPCFVGNDTRQDRENVRFFEPHILSPVLRFFEPRHPDPPPYPDPYPDPSRLMHQNIATFCCRLFVAAPRASRLPTILSSCRFRRYT